MNPATFNLLDGIVRATIKIADAALSTDESADIRTELTGQLASLKVVSHHEEGEDIVQAMARAVLALATHVLGRPVKPREDDVKKTDLLDVVNRLEQRSEEKKAITDATLHPSGACTCGNEGECEWCRTHCIHCGAEIDLLMGHCRGCGLDHAAASAHPGPLNIYGLDLRWKLITLPSGDPVVAVYSNDRPNSLTQVQTEEIRLAVNKVIRRWV